jgi:hypothetical protein
MCAPGEAYRAPEHQQHVLIDASTKEDTYESFSVCYRLVSVVFKLLHTGCLLLTVRPGLSVSQTTYWNLYQRQKQKEEDASMQGRRLHGQAWLVRLRTFRSYIAHKTTRENAPTSLDPCGS